MNSASFLHVCFPYGSTNPGLPSYPQAPLGNQDPSRWRRCAWLALPFSIAVHLKVMSPAGFELQPSQWKARPMDPLCLNPFLDLADTGEEKKNIVLANDFRPFELAMPFRVRTRDESQHLWQYIHQTWSRYNTTPKDLSHLTSKDLITAGFVFLSPPFLTTSHLLK